MVKKAKNRKTRKQLKSKIRELQASHASTYHFASQYVRKLSTDNYMASGIVVCLYKIGGDEAAPPFMIQNGFSKETIACLLADIKRSYDWAVEFKPVTE